MSNQHRVVVEFDDGIYLKRLIHPEGGCQGANQCWQCGRSFDDNEVAPCYDCNPPIDRQRECWVQGWFENVSAEELLHGSVELIVEPTFESDTCALHVVGAHSLSADHRSEGS